MIASVTYTTHTILVFPLISPTLVTLVRQPRQPLQHTVHFTHAGAPPMPHMLARHPSRLPTKSTLAHHPRQHATNANSPLMLARLPCKHATHRTQNNTNNTPFLKLLGIQLSFQSFQISNSKRKFSSFYRPYFLGLFKHFYRSLENCHRKIKLFQRNQSALFKTTILSKTNAQIFQKKLFTNISVVLAILLYNSLLKTNYFYYQF